MQKFKKGKSTYYRIWYRADEIVEGEMKRLKKSKCFTVKDDAEQFEAKHRAEKAQAKREGAELPRLLDQLPFFTWSALWLQEREKHALAGLIAWPTFKKDEGNLTRVWVPAMGKKKLVSAVTQGDIIQLLNRVMLDGCGPATRNRHLALVHKLFEDARLANRCRTNPADDIPMLSEEVKTREIGHWETLEECNRFLHHAPRIDMTFGIFSECMLGAGGRPGESLALKVKDIDFVRDEITICRTVEVLTGKVVERTKGKRRGGKSVVPLFPRLREVLKAWLAENPKMRSNPEAYIVPDPRDSSKPMTYWQMHRLHELTIAAAGVKRITPHDLRRTFASNAMKCGMQKSDVQVLLTHKSIRTTERYAITDVGHLKQLAKRRKFWVVPANGTTLSQKQRSLEGGTTNVVRANGNDYAGLPQ